MAETIADPGRPAPGEAGWRRKLAPLGFALALIAVILGAGAGFGARLGWWHFRVGFTLLEVAFFCGVAAALLSLLALILAWQAMPTGPRLLAILGLVVGLFVAAMPLRQYAIAKSVPPIHDITTDTANPPAFVAILPLRAHAEDPAEYGGPAIAALQHQGYPALAPAQLAMPPAKAFELALATARGLGWTIVAAVPAEGRIEASERSFWFGFTDDIVLRIAAEGSGSRVDLRSVSRVGRSDLGVNAARIQRFVKALDEGAAAGGA
jgi:uncharacterized protein (DUF1499 family)